MCLVANQDELLIKKLAMQAWKFWEDSQEHTGCAQINMNSFSNGVPLLNAYLRLAFNTGIYCLSTKWSELPLS